MNLPRLGVNIDHVATLRNARGENYPSPVQAALLCEKYGADGITAHLREDRRHIRDTDVSEIIKNIKIPLNFEMAPTNEMVEIAININPNACCMVPEKREEVTTEGGIDIKKNQDLLLPKIEKIKKNNILVSLFIDASEEQIKLAKEIGADIVEIHTGEYCRKINYHEDGQNEFERIKEAAIFADEIGLELHLGHGITFDSVKELSKIKEVKEFNIGHFIISESVFIGLQNSIKKFKEIIEEERKNL